MGKALSKSHHLKSKEGQVIEKDGSFNRRSRKKRYLQQMKRDRRSQRVSKEQLHKLSSELKGTAWYLGRRLQFSEDEVKKIVLMAPNEQAAKLVILMTWRKKNGWKATNQNLVILLELAGYADAEYKCVLPQQVNGQSRIYNRIERTTSTTPKHNGFFRYDSHIDLVTRNSGENRKKSTKYEQSSVTTNADDIIEFARKSWKKPSRRQNGHTQTGKPMPQTSREPRTATSMKTKQRHHGDFAINNISKHDSEAELDEVFRQDNENYAFARGRYVAASYDLTRSQHEHTFSTDSQTQEYREQILRISERQFGASTKLHDDDTALLDDRIISPAFNFYEFPLELNCFDDANEQHISGLAITKDDEIVVAENSNKEIQVFDKYGNFLNSFPTQSELNPKGLTVNNENEIVVCCGKDVRLFSTTGDMLQMFGRGSFRNNSYCVVCDVVGNYYVSDIVGHTISVFDGEGNIRKRFGNLGENLINFNQPVALAISERKRLFISDSQNHCIKIYTLAGRPLEKIGDKGSSEDGSFWNPFGICFDNRGQLLVADCGNNRISLFDANYKFIRHVLTEEDGLQMPSFISVTSTDQLIVCEWKSSLVKVYNFETSV